MPGDSDAPPAARIKGGGTEGARRVRGLGELGSLLSPPTVVIASAKKTRSDRQEVASS